MARINKSSLTKLEIIRAATQCFLEHGYSNTSLKMICNQLDMSTGNLTFYFPTKEHLLAAIVEVLCHYRRQKMEQDLQEDISSPTEICLELAIMAVMCKESEIVKDIFLSAYSSPICLEIIRQNDMERSKDVFKNYCSDWTDSQFVEAEILVSGIEFATLMTTSEHVSLETRIIGATNQILAIYDVPEEIRETKIAKVLAMDYQSISHQAIKNFKKHADQVTEQAFLDLLKS